MNNYLNIRAGAERAKDHRKAPELCRDEIFEIANGWYKISSGGITGYVKSEYILTGDAAKEAAMSHAELMAIVHADRLNARTEPSTDAKIWTQISENERYHVAEQLDGWVKIEFDEAEKKMEMMRFLPRMFLQNLWKYDMPCLRRSNSHRRKRFPVVPDRKLRDASPRKTIHMSGVVRALQEALTVPDLPCRL